MLLMAALCLMIATQGGAAATQIRVLLQSGEPQQSTHDQQIADLRKAYPDIRVQVERVPFTELYRTIAVAAATGKPPDVIYADGPMVWSYAHQGLIAPLDDYFATEDIADYLPSALAQVQYDGRIWAIPERESAMALLYNTDYTRQAGIEPPQTLDSAWTWNEALEAFKKTTRTSGSRVDVWGLVFMSTWSVYSQYPIVRSAGTPGSPTFMGMSPDGTTVDGYWNTTEALDAFQFWQDLHMKHKVAPVQQTPDMFESGLSAFYLATDMALGKIRKHYPDLNWDATPIPYFVTPMTHTGSFTLAISAASKHKDEAATFIRFMTSKEQALKSHQGIGQLPARQSVLTASPQYQKYPGKLYLETLFQWGTPRPRTIAYSEYDAILLEAMRDIGQGANVRSTVEAAVRKMDAELAKYR